MKKSYSRNLNSQKNKTLTIITVTYNSKNEIVDFVNSIKKQCMDINLWLIDNASIDSTPEVLLALAKENEWINVLLNKQNIGLAAANNQPLNLLNTSYTAIINPDVVLHDLALRRLVDYLDQHVDVAAVAPINVSSDGVPHSSFHKNWTLLHLMAWRFCPGFITQNLYKFLRIYEEQDVLFASGACLVIHTDDYKKIGGYDQEYFLTVEDVCDLCIRLTFNNPRKRVVVTPIAKITHLGSRSASSLPFVTLWNGARGSIYHFHKHYGWVAGIFAYIIVLSSIITRFSFYSLCATFSTKFRISMQNNLKVIHYLLNKNPLLIKRSKRF